MSALPTTTEELAERADELARKMREPSTFVEARAALQEAGVLKARRALAEAVDFIDVSLTSHRSAQEAERQAQDAYDEAIGDAEWELDTHFVTESNKTLLVIKQCEYALAPNWKEFHDPFVEHQCRETRPMTADERKAWKANESRRMPAVKAAADELRKATQERDRTKDEIVLAERRFSARKADLAAAVASVEVLGASLSVRSAS